MKSVLENLSDLWDAEQYDSEYNLETFMRSLEWLLRAVPCPVQLLLAQLPSADIQQTKSMRTLTECINRSETTQLSAGSCFIGEQVILKYLHCIKYDVNVKRFKFYMLNSCRQEAARFPCATRRCFCRDSLLYSHFLHREIHQCCAVCMRLCSLK